MTVAKECAAGNRKTHPYHQEDHVEDITPILLAKV